MEIESESETVLDEINEVKKDEEFSESKNDNRK